ncbi:MAG: hypothetical protein Q4B68_09125, partial [Bacteroidales bacterium]|nr:hypothetical protein [Bacteroidales bacterium]
MKASMRAGKPKKRQHREEIQLALAHRLYGILPPQRPQNRALRGIDFFEGERKGNEGICVSNVSIVSNVRNV